MESMHNILPDSVTAGPGRAATVDFVQNVRLPVKKAIQDLMMIEYHPPAAITLEWPKSHA
jgi:hypothetical protein